MNPAHTESDSFDMNAVQIDTPTQPKSFLAFLAEQKNGAVANELSKELRDLVEAIEMHVDHFGGGKVSGSLSINIKIVRDSGAYKVEMEYAVRRPKVPAASTFMWMGTDGNLATNNPRQLNLPFSHVTGGAA